MGRFINEIVFLVLCFIPVYWLASVVDFIILNLIEFWTGNVLISQGEKTIEKNGVKLTMKSIDSETVQISINDGKSVKDFYAKRDSVGKLFVQKNGEFVPVSAVAEETANGVALSVFAGSDLSEKRTVSVSEFASVKASAAALAATVESKMKGNAVALTPSVSAVR